MYQIKIEYVTGDSFGSQETEDFIDLEFNDLDNAKKALKVIKEHYAMYQELNGYGQTRSHDEVLKEYKSFSWFNEKYPEYSITFKADTGKTYKINPFWCGYFERLICASIVSKEEDDMHFIP